MERGIAAGVSPAARNCLVKGPTDRFLSHHLRTRRQPDPPALARAVSGTARIAGFPPRLRSRRTVNGQVAGRSVQRAARDLDHQPFGCRSQSLHRPSAAVLGGYARLAGEAAYKNHRTALSAVSRPGRTPRRTIRSAWTARNSHFVAQFHAGTGWQGAHGRCGIALSPRAFRRGRAVRALEGLARGVGTRTPGAPQLPLRGQGRRSHFPFAPTLPARRLRRHRTGDQPGHRLRGRPALESTA